MDDPLLVRGFERLRDLPRDRQRLVERDRSTRDPLRQIVAVDQFHHERLDAVGVLQPVDGRDVRMIQRREDFRFTLEARASRSGSAASDGGRILTATWRFSLRVRRTIHLPMPPAPRADRIS